jgi:Tetracyclin repressor-like, C-terminal domain
VHFQTHLGAPASIVAPVVARVRCSGTGLVELSSTKRRMAREDPSYSRHITPSPPQARDVVTDHLRILADQIATIVADGIAASDFAPTDPAAASRAILHATARFHHPHTPPSGPTSTISTTAITMHAHADERAYFMLDLGPVTEKALAHASPPASTLSTT